jgi:hypothetical protein
VAPSSANFIIKKYLWQDKIFLFSILSHDNTLLLPIVTYSYQLTINGGIMGKTRIIFSVGVVILLALIASVALTAYHHMGEKDSENFLAVYRGKAAGTKLDSCTVCHTGGSYQQGTKTVTLGSCQWCHYKYGYDGSGNINETLNAYGVAYRDNGRSAAAIRRIKKLDSDGDGFSNDAEIKAGRFPGDASDDPTKVYAPSVVYTREELEAMPQHTQFMLMNTTKSGDFYAEYSGVTVENLLATARISDTATSIKVYAPDGFSQYHPLEPDPAWYHVNGGYPAATYHYTTTADAAINLDYGWCDYSAPSCSGRNDGDAIEVPGGLKLLLAIKRDGAYLTPGVLTATNKLDGEGPYRVVSPQIVEGPPDVASTSDYSQTAYWPYTASWDHNAGSATRSATIVRVDPLPPGTTDINTYEAGWGYVDTAKIVVYGNILRAVSINGDAGCTSVRSVNLTLDPPGTPEQMFINNKTKIPRKSMAYAKNTQWNLRPGKGMQTVYAWFKTGEIIQGPFASSIYFVKTCPTAETAKVSD